LLEAARQTGLREAEVMLHSKEVWMYCRKVSKKEQLDKDTEAVAASS
jgi:HD superfamily phosphodiesterase